MKKILSFVILSLFFLKSESQIIEINGSLYDSLSKLNLAYGNIIVKNYKDSIITSALTNEQGEFKIKNLTFKNGMYLQTNYLGYIDKRIDFDLNNNSKINIGRIYVSQSVTHIKEATVVGKTKYMEQKFDRKVFNISETKTTSAKDIFDLLITLPGVTVDQDQNIKYKGAPATIYVDDQPAEYVYPKTEMIPVASVLKIELIDASLHSGAGKGGIINIKMKAITSDGLSGIAKTNNSTIEFKKLYNSNNYINANYKIKKIIFFDNFNYRHFNSYNSNETEGLLNYNSSSYLLHNNFSDKNSEDVLWNYVGLRFLPNPKTRFHISGGFYKDNGTFPSENYFQQNDNSTNSIYGMYNVVNTNNYDDLNKRINGSFYHSFDSIGREVSAYGGFSRYNHNDILLNTFNYQYIASTSIDSTYNYKIDGSLMQTNIYGGVYYNHPINAKTRWNCGWSGWFVFNEHLDNIYSQNEIVYLPLTSYTNGANQSQKAYWRIGTTVKKWKFDAGTSAQYDQSVANFTRYTLDSKDTLLNVNEYSFKLLPSATIIFSLDSLQEIKFTYSKSIQSLSNNHVQNPWNNQLCDFIDKTNPYNWSVGNSKLVPTEYHNLYLGYSFNKETWNINTDVFYSITNNDISNLSIPVNDVITLTMPQNIAHNRSIGVELESWVSLKKKYDLNFSSSINHTNISALDLNGADLKKKDFGYNFKFSTNIPFGDKTSGTFYVNYFSREITFEGYQYDYINSSFSLTHKFFEKKLLLTLGVNNLFDNLVKHGSYYNYGGISQNTIKNSSSYKPKYFITLQYKFRQGDRGTKDTGNGGS